MKKFIYVLVILILFHPEIYSQVVINEIMYAPAEATNEWFELYNTFDSSVNLQNWKWKDATTTIRTITTQNVNLPSKGYVIICQDSIKLKNQFPDLIGIHIQTSWNALNNSGDNLILINPLNVRIDSVLYQTSWGGNSGGFSLERINALGLSNNSLNWGTSIDLTKATPNKQNSLTPKPYDIFLKSFSISPIFPSSGETLNLDFLIKNIGLNAANNFSLNIYRDLNFDSIYQNNELINSQSYQSLNQNDSLIYSYSIQNIDTGFKQFIAKVIYQQDDDSSNNKIIRRVYVSSQSAGGGGVVINEIMYDPLANQSEWIELLNATGQIINMKGWKYKETSTSVILSVNDLFFNPGDYFLLAHDSTIFSSFNYLITPAPNQVVKFSNSISLNNSGENISIMDSLNNLIDNVFYDPNWHNPNLSDAKGISLERISPLFGSNDRNNWSSSANHNGGTPGLRNSIYLENLPANSSVSINPNPFSPDGDGFEDFTLIKYKLKFNFSQMRIKIFDIKGRLVRTLANNQITGSEATIIFNGFGDDNQKLRIGIYILLIEVIDDRGGTVDNIKAPVVIAAKL
jgi:hypothetical protein